LEYVAVLDSCSEDTKKHLNKTFYWETKQCWSIYTFTHSPNHTFL